MNRVVPERWRVPSHFCTPVPMLTWLCALLASACKSWGMVKFLSCCHLTEIMKLEWKGGKPGETQPAVLLSLAGGWKGVEKGCTNQHRDEGGAEWAAPSME